eukprot:gene14761-17440_t
MLPESLIYLEITGYYALATLPAKLPPSLHLKLGSFLYIPKDLLGRLSNSIKFLEFGATFSQPIERIVPSSVRRLNLGTRFDKTIPPGLLLNVTHLTLSSRFTQQLTRDIVPVATHITYAFDMFVPFADKHRQGSYQSIEQSIRLQFNVKIKIFIFRHHRTLMFRLIDPTKDLVLCVESSYYFNQPLPMLPKSLCSLELGHLFNQPIQPYTLPDSLTSLSFGFSFNHPLPSKLPRSLEHLSVGLFNDHPIQLPPQIQLYRTLTNREIFYPYKFNRYMYRFLNTLASGFTIKLKVLIYTKHLTTIIFRLLDPKTVLLVQSRSIGIIHPSQLLSILTLLNEYK